MRLANSEQESRFEIMTHLSNSRNRFVYVDESIHATGQFIATAIVFSDRDLQEPLRSVLESGGLRPGLDEYKSSTLKICDPQSRSLRQRLRVVLSQDGCRLALSICHISERKTIGERALRLIADIARRNSLNNSHYVVAVDQGIELGCIGTDLVAELVEQDVQVLPNSDSILVFGIQLADLCAHSAATIVKSKSGLSHKTVISDDELGYEPSTSVSLDFELWAGLRHNLASSRVAVLPRGVKPEVPEWYVEPFGLEVSERCREEVREAIRELFQTVYVGCIH